MTTTTPVTGYEILVEGEGYKDLGAIFVVSELTTRTNIGIQYFNVNTYKDLADVFYPYEFGTFGPPTGIIESGGKDLNQIFQYVPLPYIITPITSTSGAYTTSTDASNNTIITFTRGSCYITFSNDFSNKVEYTMYGGGAGGGVPVDTYYRTGGKGGGGGAIVMSPESGFSYETDTTYTINVGAGGAGGVYKGAAPVKGGDSSIKYGSTSIVSAPGGYIGGATGSNGGLGGVYTDQPVINPGFNGGGPNTTIKSGGGGGASSGVGGKNGGNGGKAGTNTTGGAGGAGRTDSHWGGAGEAAVDNSGCGGGGGGGKAKTDINIGTPGAGGAGGSGVVIFKFIK